ncbi:ornithine decarboxylase antizyme-domain-containing protein [Podospora didyma]|uniref:Ornithine decarboxylase antizyme n=1 Tax=Podospora didyma TaxID=330526 RepID=A0AAE0N574_9PEZI|nr:ornithine decarboxylase antizyme-domain-containing protein [Podospora didyma]
MAPTMKTNSSNNYSSSKYGEGIVRQANILASCYLGLSGIPEVPSTGLPSPPSSPPLAAITPTNELALTPKARKSSTSRNINHGRNGSSNSSSAHRRGGAALRIREECERFFCEMLHAMFLGERNQASQRSRLTSAYNNNNNHHHHHDTTANNTVNYFDYDHGGELGSNGGASSAMTAPLTPPDDSPMSDQAFLAANHGGPVTYPTGSGRSAHGISAWLEIWDYAGGSSFRAFLTEDAASEEKSMFVFFDAHILGRDLKQALVALIELAEGPLACSHMVICIDRSIPGEEAKALTKGLQWAGFSPTTLDFWSGGYDVVSQRWLFMGMEV